MRSYRASAVGGWRNHHTLAPTRSSAATSAPVCHENVAGRGSSALGGSNSCWPTGIKWFRVGGRERASGNLSGAAIAAAEELRGDGAGPFFADMASVTGRSPTGRSVVAAGGASSGKGSNVANSDAGSSSANQLLLASTVSAPTRSACNIASSRRPRMLALGMRRAGILLQELAQDAFQLLGNVGSVRSQGLRLLKPLFVQHLGKRLAAKHGPAGQQRVQQGAETIQVTPGVDRLPLGLLRAPCIRPSPPRCRRS